MNYTIQRLAKLAGVSTRTLRYYDQIGLLTPARLSSSGYRIYGEHEVDVLQQILFYKEMDMGLSDIKRIMEDDSFSRMEALTEHLKKLEQKQKNIELLIQTVKKSIQKEQGEITMNDQEKFMGLKKERIQENEKNYGEEIRKAYGMETVDKSNQKFINLSKGEYENMQGTEIELQSKLEAAVKAGEDPKGSSGKEIAGLHKEWLSYTWPSYSSEAHKALVEMYVADKRFQSYYDKNIKGCAVFLRDAIRAHA